MFNNKNKYALLKLNITNYIIPKINIRKPITNIKFITSRKLITKPNIRKPVIKQTIRKPFIKPTIRKPDIRQTIRKSVIRPTIRKPDIRETIRKSVIRPTIKNPVIIPTIKKSVIAPTMKNPINIRQNTGNKITYQKINMLKLLKETDIIEMPIESINLINGKRKYIALLISGEIRTFVFKEQIDFFKRLIDYLYLHFENVHVYLLLKIPISDKAVYIYRKSNLFICSKQGLENFNELLSILKPIYNFYFYDFNLDTNSNYSQMKMIDILIIKATNNEKKNKMKYDMFFRIRPDSCVLINELKIDTLIENYIYTSIKNDSIGSDQIFIFNQNVLKLWWPYIQLLCNTNRMVNLPDYTIYNKHKNIVQQKFQNWLIRSYKQQDNWNWKESRKPLYSEYLWQYEDNYNKLLIKMPHKIFLQQLIENIKIYDGIVKNYWY